MKSKLLKHFHHLIIEKVNKKLSFHNRFGRWLKNIEQILYLHSLKGTLNITQSVVRSKKLFRIQKGNIVYAVLCREGGY